MNDDGRRIDRSVEVKEKMLGQKRPGQFMVYGGFVIILYLLLAQLHYV